MGERVLLGEGRNMASMTREEWEQAVAKAPEVCRKRLSFMTEDHHRVRYFVVRELPITGEPLEIETIASKTNLTLDRINGILDDLEHHLLYLYRNPEGKVAWAYPVTVDQTPHYMTFSTGERLYAA